MILPTFSTKRNIFLIANFSFTGIFFFYFLFLLLLYWLSYKGFFLSSSSFQDFFVFLFFLGPQFLYQFSSVFLVFCWSWFWFVTFILILFILLILRFPHGMSDPFQFQICQMFLQFYVFSTVFHMFIMYSAPHFCRRHYEILFSAILIIFAYPGSVCTA